MTRVLRSYNQRVLDDFLSGTSSTYTGPQWDELLASFDQLTIQVICEMTSGTGVTVSVAIENSSDRRNWTQKKSLSEINAVPIDGTKVWSLTGYDDGVFPSLGFVRLRITLGGTTPSTHLRIFVCGREGNAFAPTQIGGCVLWLRADRGITLNGTTVSAWTDQSGNGNNLAQSTAGMQPLYVPSGTAALQNQPLVRFSSASGTYLAGGSASWVSGSGMTLAASFTSTSAAVPAEIFSKTYVAMAFGLQLNSGTAQFWAVNDAQVAGSSAALDDGAAHSLIGSYDSTTSPSTSLYVGGVLQTTRGTTTGNIPATSDQNGAGAAVYAAGGAGAYLFDGDIPEIIMYNRALAPGEIQVLQAYLASRYAA